MLPPVIAQRRLCQQRLTCNAFTTAEAVVAWFGAVQSQEYLGASRSLGLRMQAATDTLIDQAFNNGAILRTHVMRPTWHFVAPADIRWLLALTASRVEMKLKGMDRNLGLDREFLYQCYGVLTDALKDKQALIRPELGEALARYNIFADGLRLTHIVMHAELDAVLCSGPRRGKQFTYMLLEERVPSTTPMRREETLAELVRRYYTSHGPATVKDFVWWSGLTVADAKLGLAGVGADLVQEKVENETYIFSHDTLPVMASVPEHLAFLLPTYDEFFVGFADFDFGRRGGRERPEGTAFEAALVMNGQVAGKWRRELKKDKVIVNVTPFEPLSLAQKEAVEVAAQRYGDFLGLAITLLISE